MDIFKIKGVIKNYDWGTDDYLYSLVAGSKDKKQAEYWMGTHPSGEAETESGAKLSSAIGHSLPFLFKVLSIASPLSLQCHPDKKQAEDGWKREEEKRKKGEAYNYQDDNEKAEILSAVTPVTALCGFKEFDEIVSSLKAVIPLTFRKYLARYSSIKELFLGLFTADRKVKDEILNELDGYISSSNDPLLDGEWLTERGIIRKTLDKYPGDIGSVFPLMMNIVRLKPFDALYLKPDTLHAYLKGNGIELMTASDNVLRGGLTPKRVDIAELGRIMYFGPTKAERVEEKEENGILWYLSPSPDFSLGVVKEKATAGLNNDSIVLSLGESAVKCGVETIVLKKGECAFIPGDGKKVEIETDSSLYIATSVRNEN